MKIDIIRKDEDTWIATRDIREGELVLVSMTVPPKVRCAPRNSGMTTPWLKDDSLPRINTCEDYPNDCDGQDPECKKLECPWFANRL